jgi:hypothetical protein
VPQFLSESTERDLALRVTRVLVGRVDEVWVYGKPTAGMCLEIAEAERLGIPVVMKELPSGKKDSGRPPRSRGRGAV